MGEKKNLNRRQLLKSATVLGGAAGVAAVFQNCGQVKMNSAASDSSLSCPDDTSRTQTGNVNQIGGTQVNPVVPGSNDDISASYIEVLHYSQSNTSDSNSQKILLVGIGPDPLHGNYAPIRFDAGKSLTGVSEILVYVQGVQEPVLRRVFNAGDVVPETIFLLGDSLIANVSTVTVVLKNVATGYWKKDVALNSPLAYKDFVNTFVANTPFGSSTFTRPYVAGAGLASGGQGDLGALHTPMFSLSGDNLDLSLGAGGTTHPRISENHYVAGAGIYDQNGHPIGPVATIMYGSNYPNFSHAQFSNLNLAARGTTLIRGVIFDTYNGYLMGFYKI